MDSDLTLLARYASRGDAIAFTELTRRYRAMVFSVARRITGNHHDAEDVAQHCFLELARRASEVTDSIPGWLHRQAKDRSVDLIRRASRRQRREQDAAASTDTSSPSWAQLGPIIDAAVEELPDEQRIPVILYYLQGFSQDEIADVLNISQRTISRRLQAGIRTLRQIIGKAGVLTTVVALSVLLKANAVEATSSSLHASLAKIGMSGIGARNNAIGGAAAAMGVGSLTSTSTIVSLLGILMASVALALAALAMRPVDSTHSRAYDILHGHTQPFMPMTDPLAQSLRMHTLASDRLALWRGGADLFWNWAAEQQPAWFADEDDRWLTAGHLHLGQIGTYAMSGQLGQLRFGLVDFDEAAVVPFQTELVQGLVTLRLVARESKLTLSTQQWSGVDRCFVHTYRQALGGTISDGALQDHPIVAGFLRVGERTDYRQTLEDYCSDGRFRRQTVRRREQVRELLRPAPLSKATIAAALAQAFGRQPALAAATRYASAADIEARIKDVAQRTRLGADSSQGLAKYLVLLDRPVVGIEHDLIVYLKQQVPGAAIRAGAAPDVERTPSQSVADAARQLCDREPFMLSWCEINGQSFTAQLRDPWSMELSDIYIRDVEYLGEMAVLMGHVAGASHHHAAHAQRIALRLTEPYIDELRAAADACVVHLDEQYRRLTRDPRTRRDTLAAKAAIASWLAEEDKYLR